jgi:hypothetical protein
MKSEGEKTPPEAPDPRVNDVAPSHDSPTSFVASAAPNRYDDERSANDSDITNSSRGRLQG